MGTHLFETIYIQSCQPCIWVWLKKDLYPCGFGCGLLWPYCDVVHKLETGFFRRIISNGIGQ